MPMEIVPTYGNVLRVWWAYSWRWLAFGVCAAALCGFLFAAIVQMAGLNADMSEKAGMAVTFIISLLAAPHWAIRRLLTKGFGHYRLALVEK